LRVELQFCTLLLLLAGCLVQAGAVLLLLLRLALLLLSTARQPAGVLLLLLTRIMMRRGQTGCGRTCRYVGILETAGSLLQCGLCTAGCSLSVWRRVSHKHVYDVSAFTVHLHLGFSTGLAEPPHPASITAAAAVVCRITGARYLLLQLLQQQHVLVAVRPSQALAEVLQTEIQRQRSGSERLTQQQHSLHGS
jgi:hypothetical protein